MKQIFARNVMETSSKGLLVKEDFFEKQSKQYKLRSEPLVLLLDPFASLAPLDAPNNRFKFPIFYVWYLTQNKSWQIILTTCDFALLALRASTGKA